MTIAALLFINALITALAFFICWLIACKIKDVSFVDSWWALGLVLTHLGQLHERVTEFGTCRISDRSRHRPPRLVAVRPAAHHIFANKLEWRSDR